MRIVIATGIFPPDIGGPALYTERLARSFAARGDTVTVLAYGTKISSSAYSYTVHCVSRGYPTGLRHLFYMLRLFTFVRSADSIFCQDTFSVGLPCALVCALLGKHFFLRIPGDFAWESARNRNVLNDSLDAFQTRRSYPLRISLIRAIQRWVCRKSGHIIVPSKYIASLVVGWGIPRGKISVVYNAALINEVSSRPSSDTNTVVSIGRLVSWKGFFVLIRAMARAAHEEPRLRLCIIGDGPLRESLEREIDRLRAREIISIIGALSHADAEARLRAASLCALNTEYEGMSHVLLEAMASGIPVVTTDLPANREIITDRVTGRLLAYNNEDQWKSIFLECARTPDVFRAYAARAEEYIRVRHIWGIHWRALLAILSSSYA